MAIWINTNPTRIMTRQRNRLKLIIDRALANSFWRQIGILAILFVVLLVLSYSFVILSGSNWKEFCADKKLNSWLLPIYLLIDTNALNNLYIGSNSHGWMLFASCIIYLIGLFIFNGMIIGIITNAIENRVKKHNNGLLHYLRSGHYIIMGYDDMVPSIINDIFRNPGNAEANILLLTSVDANTIRERLRKSVAKDKMDQIFINYGQRTSKEYYKEIRLENSKEVFIVGKRDHSAHDAVNVECAENVFAYLRENKSPIGPRRITCVFEDLDTYAAFKTTEIFQGLTKDLNIEFLPYNFYTGWARQVFIARSYREKMNSETAIPYPSVYGEGLTSESDKFVHLVFVGTSNFSVAFAMEAAHLLHFPNFEKDNSLKTRITFIDQNADDELQLFSTRNRHFFEVQPYYYQDISEIYNPYAKYTRKKNLLSKAIGQHDFLDVEFEFIKGDVFSPNVQKLIRKWSVDKKQCLSLFFAMSDQRKNFIIGMNMPDEVYDNGINVFIRQNRADDFVTSLRRADAEDDNGNIKKINYHYAENEHLKEKEREGRYAHIYPFGMEDMAYFSDELALRQAKLINYLYWTSENNRFKDTLILNGFSTETLWREAERYWSECKVAEKWSNLYAAYSITCKLDTLRVMRNLKANDHSKDLQTLSYKEEEELAAVEHNRWNVEKLLMGYRKARPEEDKYLHPAFASDFKSNKKELYIHHDIRPFKDLDDIQQMDYEIVKYIPWILMMTFNKQIQ